MSDIPETGAAESVSPSPDVPQGRLSEEDKFSAIIDAIKAMEGRFEAKLAAMDGRLAALEKKADVSAAQAMNAETDQRKLRESLNVRFANIEAGLREQRRQISQLAENAEVSRIRQMAADRAAPAKGSISPPSHSINMTATAAQPDQLRLSRNFQ
jgi:hypothetical protein